MKILPNCRSGAVDNIWNKFGVKPPDKTFQLTSSSRNGAPSFNKYAQLKNKIDMQKKTLQQLMQRGAMGQQSLLKCISYRSSLLKENRILSPHWCAQPAGKPFNCALLAQMTLNESRLNRMVREESFTSLAKLGPGTEGSFTSLLVSRVS
jgi:hypothetical protein